jgi:hypothetical protein
MPIRKEPIQSYSTRIYDWQVDQIPSNDITHDKLIHAFQMYYKANLHWLQAGTKKSAIDARYWLSEINQLTIARRKVILEWKKTVSDKDNPDRSFKPSTKKARKDFQRLSEELTRNDKYKNE